MKRGVVQKMEQLVPNRGTVASNVWMRPSRIVIVASRLHDGAFCGMPLALANRMNHQTPNQFESTYALLVRSEEKGRGVLETVLYIAFILSAVLLIWEFAQSSVIIPAAEREQTAVSQAAKIQIISQI
jgi:hypothetical protein